MNKQPHIKLDIKRNDKCKKCKNKSERKFYDNEDCCGEILSIEDHLPVRCVGKWAYDKIYRLVQYFGIFSKGMYKIWNGLNYIEICCGPGRCVLRETGEEVNGTALAIIKDDHFKYIKRALFIDSNEKAVEVLNNRIQQADQLNKAYAVVGDYTDEKGLVAILKQLDKGYLNLVFIDPTNCNVPFKTIQSIAESLHDVDFIINVALGTDASRNLISAIQSDAFGKVREKYASFLGGNRYFMNREVIEAAQQNNNMELRRIFAETYKQELEKLGYIYTDMRAVRHYYYLLFASKNSRGHDFWKKACTYSPDGQKELFQL